MFSILADTMYVPQSLSSAILPLFLDKAAMVTTVQAHNRTKCAQIPLGGITIKIIAQVGWGQEYGLVPVFKFSLRDNLRGGYFQGIRPIPWITSKHAGNLFTNAPNALFHVLLLVK